MVYKAVYDGPAAGALVEKDLEKKRRVSPSKGGRAAKLHHRRYQKGWAGHS